MSYPQGSTITKANMISDFNTLVITSRNNSIVWALGEGPWTAPSGTSGDPFYPNNALSGTYVSGSADPLGSRNASAIGTGALTDLISASNVYSSFVTAANSATNIRKVHLIKYYNDNGSYVNQWDYTQVGSMSAGYLTTVTTSSNPNSGDLVTASGLDSFVNSIYSSINVTANTVVGFSEYYCHSSCHSSCHNSRGRR